ncbi:hypothetical protein [Halogeometricum limi]|uniref:Uncharacterized protein n=1 Tax=Halogeometricum limi TaxID=555875 RepID=A0A1I6GMB0_9EURY|nr:hypothetical protein [Halogeometricum limi]SFR43187.1 hypothetical protein SAMN04488124_1246 [Halogeometricum limi]
MNDPDESGPADDPAGVAETLQRHLDGPDTETVGALQPVVEAVAGWRDADDVTPADWLTALEVTPDVLYLRTDDGVLRHRPETADADADDRFDPEREPFRFARTGAEGPAEPVDREAAATLLEDRVIRIGTVETLSTETRTRFLSEQ